MKLEEIKKVIEKFKNYSLDEFELIRSFESIRNDAKRNFFLEKIKELESQLKLS